MLMPIGIAVLVVVGYLLSCIRVLYEFQRGVVFRLGRVLAANKGPGIILVFWPIDRLVTVSLRTFVRDVPSQDVITKDNVSVAVNAVVYFRVVEPSKAVLEVEDYHYATHQLSQTTLRSIVGEAELDELLSEREKINQKLQQVIDESTDPWGIKVSMVELKDVELPEHMRRVMAKQAEAERERRAKIIHAEGEFEAATKLQQAAAVMAAQPLTMQLRYLQTLVEIGAENNTTVVFPLPLDLIESLMGDRMKKPAG